MIAGVERRLLFWEVLLVVITFTLFTLSWTTLVVTLFVLTLCHPFLRRVTKDDPMFSLVFPRFLHHQDFYPPLSELDVSPPRVVPFFHGLY